MNALVKHKKLAIALAVCLCVCCGGLYVILFRYQHTSPARLLDQYGGTIPRITSSVDRDRDGVDDQTDILNGALQYIATRPKYKSRYYQSGYPDDAYGVCTDVVAGALKSAGYDLMALVAEDIANAPGDYRLDAPDANIDFRRVRNLKVYFAHTAIGLTTDVSAIDQWQGGDVVIFQSHIGIVSDRRNANGVPYVIHHNGPWQTAYEQDILEIRDDLEAHYRVTE